MRKPELRNNDEERHIRGDLIDKFIDDEESPGKELEHLLDECTEAITFNEKVDENNVLYPYLKHRYYNIVPSFYYMHENLLQEELKHKVILRTFGGRS
jgi:hypothetical protein